MIRKSISLILSFIFPPSCYVCHREGEALCTTCLSSFSKNEDTPSPCITSIYSFRNKNLKRIIHSIKYFHRKDLIAPFAKALGEAIMRDAREDYILIPIPMPKWRMYTRGYNHAEALAKEISIITSLPLQTDILFRSSLHRRQVTTVSRKERLENQCGAFVSSRKGNGKKIILIDDVTTTGATLLEARKILLASGASHVVAYTIAH